MKKRWQVISFNEKKKVLGVGMFAKQRKFKDMYALGCVFFIISSESIRCK